MAPRLWSYYTPVLFAFVSVTFLIYTTAFWRYWTDLGNLRRNADKMTSGNSQGLKDWANLAAGCFDSSCGVQQEQP
ncbi:hypothetical protein BU16DRAFT_530365 [Lophium mytilinum]|uniref:Uncharacterized protein n=1 Tax=Lophium mytilinum TaxID=390894 RepID=A0A6A6QFB8_9PEZI|nr:hypothetical protein BU16DRAFT_530365 [Lophium mytilinum]